MRPEPGLAVDPPLAVVLPTLDGAAFIGEQLDALHTQDAPVPWHLVVVDGGSTDGTLDVVERHRRDDIPLRVVRLDGAPGVNAGLNAGIAATTSPLILIAEHDDVVAPGWMRALHTALQDHHLVGSHMDRFTLTPPEVASSRRRLPEDVTSRVPLVVATGLGLRRSLWEELGGFDESYRYGGNDVEFCFRAHAAGYRAVLVDDALVRYRLRPGARSAFRQTRAYGIAIVRLYREFGAGYIERRPLRHVARELLRLGWWAFQAPWSRAHRLRAASRAGMQLGLLEGSFRYRRWFP